MSDTRFDSLDQRYDPFDPEIHADPDPWFDALRERCPVHHHAERDFYTVSRSDGIATILRNPEAWSSRYRNGLTREPAAEEPMLLDADPPTHTWQRRLLQKAWTPRLINALEPRVREAADALLSAVAPAGRCDFHEVFSSVLPVTMITELVGVPAEDRATFKAWSDARVEVTAGTPGALEAGQQANREMATYFADHVARRRAALADDGTATPDDYTTMLLTTTHEGRGLTDVEVCRTLQLLVLGGIETTTLHLGNLLHRVIVEPGLADAIRTDPSLAEQAVEESLRLDAVTLGLFRTPNVDTEVCGVTIPADAKTTVLFAAVNRDPALYDDPHAFRLDRDPVQLRRHFGFGHGIHLCLGAPLARLEGRVALQAIVEHLPGVRYTEAPRRLPTMIFRGFDRQPIAWDVVPGRNETLGV